MTDPDILDAEAAARMQAKIESLGATAALWTDDEFVSRVVQLLILDEGVVNKWERTIRLSLQIYRAREKVLNAHAKKAIK